LSTVEVDLKQTNDNFSKKVTELEKEIKEKIHGEIRSLQEL